MEYISSFLYCDSVQMQITPEGPVPQIVKPLQFLEPVAIPSNYSFTISCNIAGFDVNVKNSIRFQFISPEDEVVYDSNNIEFELPQDEKNVNMPNVMQFNMDMRNLVLREKGLYSTKVYFNNKLMNEYKIEVIVSDDNERRKEGK